MEITRGYRVRLLPTKDQEEMLWKSAGVMRYVYNYCIEYSQRYYRNTGKIISQVELSKAFTVFRNKYPWLKEVSADIPKQATKDFDKARKHSFKEFKNPYHINFKSKKDLEQSFYNDYIKTKVKGKKVLITKIGWIRTSERIKENTRLSNPRIVFDGQYWYISFSIKEKLEILPRNNKKVLGVDLGIKDLAVTSEGDVFENINKTPKMRKLFAKKRKYQKEMSRRYKKGESTQSKNYQKSKEKHLRISRKIGNIQDNHIHQVTNYLAKTKHKYVAIEDLNIKGMLKNKKLSKAISQQRFYEFRTRLEYKLKRNGGEMILIDRFYPSSQLCSVCDTKYDNENQEIQWGLHVREWTCHKCQAYHNRDENAAKNIAKEGLRKYFC